MPTITISLTDAEAEAICKWASVSRTLTTAIDMCERVSEQRDGCDLADMCADELQDMRGWLDRLHQTTRNGIWKAKRDATIATLVANEIRRTNKAQSGD